MFDFNTKTAAVGVVSGVALLAGADAQAATVTRTIADDIYADDMVGADVGDMVMVDFDLGPAIANGIGISVDSGEAEFFLADEIAVGGVGDVNATVNFEVLIEADTPGNWVFIDGGPISLVARIRPLTERSHRSAPVSTKQPCSASGSR